LGIVVLSCILQSALQTIDRASFATNQYIKTIMLSQPISVQFNLDEKRQVTLGTGKLARQADGAITVRQGNCVILATVVANKEPKDGQSFFPIISRLSRKICICRSYSWFIF
jgi:hypothetical protein